MAYHLWNILDELKAYEWVDLTHPLNNVEDTGRAKRIHQGGGAEFISTS